MAPGLFGSCCFGRQNGEDDTQLDRPRPPQAPKRSPLEEIKSPSSVNQQAQAPSQPSIKAPETPSNEEEHLSAAATSPAPTKPDHGTPGLSLWDRAYEALRKENPELVDKYEKLLSKELPASTDKTTEDLDHVDNHINSGSARLSQLKQITEQGREHMEQNRIAYTIFGHKFILREQVATTANFIQEVRGFIDDAVKASPEASLAWTGVSMLLPVLTNPATAEQENNEGLIYVTSRLRWYAEFESFIWPSNLKKPGLKDLVEEHIIELYQHILDYQISSVLRFYYTRVVKLARDLILRDGWEGRLSKVKELEIVVRNDCQEVGTAASQQSLRVLEEAAQRHVVEWNNLITVLRDAFMMQTKQLNEVLRHLEDLKRVNKPINLSVAYDARYGSARVQADPKCEEGTRVSVQKEIDQWADDPAADPLFWLVGPAGTGKSTVARTIADVFNEKGQLAAGYFFKRGEAGRNEAARVLPTIANQLMDHIPDFKYYLADSLDGITKEDLEKRALNAQCDILLLKPLEKLRVAKSAGNTRVIIVDAIDECEGDSAVLALLISVLYHLGQSSGIRLRILITSRSDPGIVDAFEALGPHHRLELHRKFPEESKRDLEKFMKTNFAIIKKKARIHSEPWPTPDQLGRLLELATTPEPLFIYVATLCRHVYDERKRAHTKRRLEQWLEECDTNTSQLDQLYTPILLEALPGIATDELFQEQLRMLGSIALFADPLPVSALAALLGMDEDETAAGLAHLHAVLDVPADAEQPVRILHKSFIDYLLESKTKPQEYHVDHKQTNVFVAESSCRVMNSSLRRDICRLEDIGISLDSIDKARVKDGVPLELEYACRYWTSHLERSGFTVTDNGVFFEFFRTHVLHWLEVLSLIGRLPGGIRAIAQLLRVIEATGTAAEFGSFANDASRLLSTFIFGLEQYPLQVYGTALVFSPDASEIKQTRRIDRLVPGLQNVHDARGNWGPLLQTLEGHSKPVRTIALSRDGKLIASGSTDKTVRIWDLTTGSHLRTLEGHTGPVTAVAFSPDGRVVASGALDATVRLWNVKTGAHQQTLEDYDDVDDIAFSPDGETIAASFRRSYVQLWEVSSGLLKHTLETPDTHGDIVLAFSADGQTITAASFWVNSCTQYWSVKEGSLLRTLDGVPVTQQMVLSPDGKFIALTAGSTTSLQDAATGTIKSTLQHDHGLLTTVAFSPNSRILALGYREREPVRLWDTATECYLGSLEGHSAKVTRIAFSPDGKLLATASQDKTIRIWDITSMGIDQSASRQSASRPDPGDNSATIFGWSPDGRVLASDPEFRSVSVWDIRDTHVTELEVREYEFGLLSFSLDGRSVACGFLSSVRLFDITDEATEICTLDDNHGFLVSAIALSPDRRSVASGYKDGRLQIWDLTRLGKSDVLYEGHGHDEEPVDRLAFSTDATSLAASYADIRIEVWVDKTRRTVINLKEFGLEFVQALAFSPDGRRLVSSHDESVVIRLWDPTTGTLTHSVETEAEIWRLAFNPEDGSRLVTNGGVLRLPKEVIEGSAANSSAQTTKLEYQGYGVTPDKIWIKKGSKRILWLPPNLRVRGDVIGSTIIMGDRSTHKIFPVHFDDPE